MRIRLFEGHSLTGALDAWPETWSPDMLQWSLAQSNVGTKTIGSGAPADLMAFPLFCDLVALS
jgi:hypothetical protein